MTPRMGNVFGDKTQRMLRRMISHERLAKIGNAVDYANYELVPGDILEFGIFTGRTLAALSYANAHSQYTIPFSRTIHGFDSFAGLPSAEDTHPRWERATCASNHLQSTPTISQGSPVGAAQVHALFTRLRLPRPSIHEGIFSDTIPAAIPQLCSAAAVVHIDCDIYESARDVLFGIESILQDGSVLLFDDWFHYKAHPARGEQRAFTEFLAAFPHWRAVDYGNYGIFCKAFILSREQ